VSLELFENKIQLKIYDDLLVSLILNTEEENQIVQQEIQVIQQQLYVVEDHREHL
jgi:hypothetical protein